MDQSIDSDPNLMEMQNSKLSSLFLKNEKIKFDVLEKRLEEFQKEEGL